MLYHYASMLLSPYQKNPPKPRLFLNKDDRGELDEAQREAAAQRRAKFPSAKDSFAAKQPKVGGGKRG